MRKFALSVMLMVALFSVNNAFADGDRFLQAILTSDQVVPPPPYYSGAIGLAVSEWRTHQGNIVIFDLNSSIIACEIRGGARGQTGPLVYAVPNPQDCAGPAELYLPVDWTGQPAYVQVYTNDYPNGEIRGQIEVIDEFPFPAGFSDEDITAGIRCPQSCFSGTRGFFFCTGQCTECYVGAVAAAAAIQALVFDAGPRFLRVLAERGRVALASLNLLELADVLDIVADVIKGLFRSWWNSCRTCICDLDPK